MIAALGLDVGAMSGFSNAVVDEEFFAGTTLRSNVLCNLGYADETALAALVGCVNVIGHKCAAEMGVDIGHLEIDAVCAFDRRGVTLAEEIDVPFTAVTLTLRADGQANDAALARVGVETEKFCP